MGSSSLITPSSPFDSHNILLPQIKAIRPKLFPPGRSLRFTSAQFKMKSTYGHDMQRRISSLESLFRYDKSIPEEIIEKPTGVLCSKKDIGSNLPCNDCEAKGVTLCTTCSGSGLYVDSIMESQGIIVKIRCLGCGGTGNIMCAVCGGRGHAEKD